MSADELFKVDNKNQRNQTIVFFVFLGLLTLVILLAIKSRNTRISNPTDLQNPTFRETEDLYDGVPLDRDQRGLLRGRFVDIGDNSITVETYLRHTEGEAVREAVSFSDDTLFNCEERYFLTSDGTKVDKFAAMIDTSNYNGELVTGGLGINWFKKNVKPGEAVEIRFLGDGSSRIPTQILLYRDECKSD